MTIEVLTWLLAVVLVVLLVGARAVDAWRTRRCQRIGHDWTADVQGYACRRCKGRRDVGDFM